MTKAYYISPFHDVYVNLVLEEYLARNFDFQERQVLLIYINHPCVVMGKNQNYLKEVNLQYVFDHAIPVARRVSGGGTVVHDVGNINFAFIESMDYRKVNKYENSTGLLVDVIQNLGVPCYLNARNAIILQNEKKISGSAQFTCSRSILSHFSVLYDADLEFVNHVLTPNLFQIDSKASDSVRSVVDNLSHHLKMTRDEFIMKSLELLGYHESLNISEDMWSEIKSLADSRTSPEYVYDKACHGSLRKGDIYIALEDGKIKEIAGISDAAFYLGRRLHYNEIPSDKELWTYLLRE